jgi:hypothetical protein
MVAVILLVIFVMLKQYGGIQTDRIRHAMYL